MSTVTYPSPVVPGPPPIRLEVPQAWSQVWVPDTLIAVRDDARGAHHFLANLVVRHSQRPGPVGGDEVTAELMDFVRQRPQGRLGPLRTREVDGRELVGADLTFTDPQAGAVAQVHWFWAQPHGEVSEVVQVIGSCAVSRREDDAPTIDRVVDSVRISA